MAVTEKSIEFLGNSLNAGRPLPGQSLTNSPDQQYAWERPPQTVDTKDAMVEVFEALTEPEALRNTLIALDKGVGVIDIASITLYTAFIEGKFNPDVMLLLMEPTMYMVMSLAEKADIQYTLDSADGFGETELSGDEKVKQLQGAVSTLDDVRKKAVQDVNPQSVPEDIKTIIEDKEISPSLLSQVKDETSNSLLGKQD
jgi:hypothetical protein|tara:strand:- start:1374 stop:1970 length:597 start_codon:yes stop_codon:yes gene_type:complete